MSDLDRLMQLHYELGRVIREHVVRRAAPDDINLHQLQALICINERAGLTMSELAAFMKIHSPSATALVTRLEKAGLARRAHDKANRKLVRLRLTPKGVRFMETTIRKKQQVFRDIFELLSASDQRELARILADLVSAYRTTHAS